MLGNADVVGFFGGVDDPVGALLQRTFELLIVRRELNRPEGYDLLRE